MDPAPYRSDAEGWRVEKGVGEQGLLELRRQARLLQIKDLEDADFVRLVLQYHIKESGYTSGA